MAPLTSYNGWPASKYPNVIDVDPAFEVLGQRFPGGVKRGDVSTLFRHLVTQLDERVEPLDRDAVKDDWGYVFKQSANSADLISCHSSGTAIDYNATRHPNGKRGTWSAAQNAEIRRILAEFEGTIRWLALKADGGGASRTPDEMHFEIHGTAAEVAAVADKIRRNQGDDDVTQQDIDKIVGGFRAVMTDVQKSLHADLVAVQAQLVELREAMTNSDT